MTDREGLGDRGPEGHHPLLQLVRVPDRLRPREAKPCPGVRHRPPPDVLTTTRNSDGATVDSAFGQAAFVLQFIALRNLSDHFGKSHWYVLGIILLPSIFRWRLSANASIKE